jgi:hypothetical protein
VYYVPVSSTLDTTDLVDAIGVAEVLGLANRTSVSAYQRRYPRMPRPVVDLGRGRPRLWSRRAIEEWAQREGPRVIAKFIADTIAKVPRGPAGSAQNRYRGVLQIAMEAALGPRTDGPRTVGEAHWEALAAARQVDPLFDRPAPPEFSR